MTGDQAALLAAVRVATNLGIGVNDPVVLSDSNNLVLWLRPAPIVAKVGSGHHRRLGLELSVARHLAAFGAPIVAPAPGLPCELHREGTIEVTLWTHQPHTKRVPDPNEIAEALRHVHAAMLAYPAPLPSFSEELDSVAEVLADSERSRSLSDIDRATLRRALSDLRGRLDTSEPVPLHGSPHDGNTLTDDDTVRFVDFETACVGPLEWDLAHLSAEAADAYPDPIDLQRLQICRALVSAKTATWCWANYDHPHMRWHAKHHLQAVQRFMADFSGR